MSLADFSIVQWYEGAEPHKCGYCNRNGNISNGMWAERLTVEDYQDLLDRGWRRSGKYCYKSIMNETCCPLYTIKCDAVNFSISKSQKRVIKKFKRFLKDGDLNLKNYLYDTHFEEPESSRELPVSIPEFNLSDISSIPDLSERVPQEGSTCDTNTNFKQKENNFEQIKGKCDNRVIGADPDKPKCRKAKFLRIERKKEKALKKGIPFNDTPRVPTRKALEEFFEEVLSEDNKHKLRTCLIPTSRSNSSWQAQEAVEFQLYKKYQMVIHNDPPSKLTVNGFCRFLVDSPLKPKNFPDGIEGPGYGSFHQQYWLGDKLIAVGVIDILPKCVSSVYFFYDPDYRGLTLGTYGSLREILLTRQLQKSLPDLGNYYMGFYIHSCQKMRYKGKLKPSVLLCPETYYWIPIEKCIPLLNISVYSRLNEDLDAIDPNLPSEQEILKIQIIFRNRLMSCSRYIEFVDEQEKYMQIGKLIGRKCVKNIIFFE